MPKSILISILHYVNIDFRVHYLMSRYTLLCREILRFVYRLPHQSINELHGHQENQQCRILWLLSRHEDSRTLWC